MDICELTNNADWNQARHPWERARVKVVADLIRGNLDITSTPFHCLDIGSGDAYMAKCLSKLFPGITFHCIDTAYDYEIKQQIGAELDDSPIMLHDSIENFKADNPEIVPNLILLLDVIEHIEDDIAFLNYLRGTGSVGQDSKVLITVPAYQNLFSSHDVFLRHFRRYNIERLHHSVEAAGMEVVEDGYFFTSLALARFIQKTFGLGDQKEKQKGISDYKPKFMLDGIIYNTLIADYNFSKLLRKLGFRSSGLSCYGICKIKQES